MLLGDTGLARLPLCEPEADFAAVGVRTLMVEPSLVSVVVPCYNHAHFLGEAIESALAQTYPYLEIIVVDDGSSDNTREVAARYPQVRYVRQENQGLAAARNTGLRHSTGSYLVFLDADDRLLSQAVEMGLHQLQAHPDCAFAFGRWRQIAVDGSPLPKAPIPRIEIEGDHYVCLLQRNHVEMHATVVYRRTALEAVGAFDPTLRAAEDYDLYLRIARQYPICSHGAIVAEYRRYGSNMTNDPALMLRSAVTVLRRQRPYVKRNEYYASAYCAGAGFWYGRYGRPLRAQAAADEWGRPLHGLAVLMRDPVLAMQDGWSVLWRHRLAASVHPRCLKRTVSTRFRELRSAADIAPRQRPHRQPGRSIARLQRQLPRQGLILLYHRIAATPTDPWSLNVMPDHFAEHLQVLKSHGDLVSLADLLQMLQDQTGPERMIALTFDDGYANNLHAAKPLLKHFAVPATVYVTVGAIESPGEQWWDELDGLLLQPGTLPDALQLYVNGRPLVWKLGDAAHYTEDAFRRLSSWRAWENPPGARQALYRSVWELLHRLPIAEREGVLDQLRAWAGVESFCRPTHRFLSRAEALELADGPWVTLGAHTMTHPSLAKLTVDAQRIEIEQSRSRLMELLGRPVSSFAYPFGKRSDYSEKTIEVVREVGFSSACSAFAGVVRPSTGRFELPRFHVHDSDGDEFSRQLSASWRSGELQRLTRAIGSAVSRNDRRA
jgi:glycosyltransferase involved in cell wall biosynthesis/peptidoglycan/xylan/chitin deacetylase (PgdA/CDA1 family)